MRGSAHSPLGTTLLLIPILAVPLLAIFGVPQLTPVVPNALKERSQPSQRDAPEFVPGPSRDWQEFADVEPPANDAIESNWPDVMHDATARTLADRRNEARIQRVAGNRSAAQPLDNSPARDSATRLRHAVPETMPRELPDAFAGEGAELVQTADVREPQPRLGQQPVGRTRPSATRGPADALTWRSAVQRLNDLEIRNFRLEPGQQAEQFVFICSYTPQDNPSISYRFEAEADEPLRAVEKVLAQIDVWLAAR
jgi:hypothetical protein